MRKTLKIRKVDPVRPPSSSMLYSGINRVDSRTMEPKFAHLVELLPPLLRHIEDRSDIEHTDRNYCLDETIETCSRAQRPGKPRGEWKSCHQTTEFR